MEIYEKLSKTLIISSIILFIIIFIAFLPNYYSFDFQFFPFKLNTDLNIKAILTKSFNYVEKVLHGDLGRSSSGLTVQVLIKDAFLRSSILILSSFFISFFLGIFLSLVTSLNKTASRIYNLIASIGISIPDVFLIICLQSLVVYLHMSGHESLPLSGSDSLKH